MASEHTARAYDEELRRLSNTVAEMGGLAESQLGTAIEAVMTRDTELAARVVEGDVKVDQLERELDNLAIRLLALASTGGARSAGDFLRAEDRERSGANR